MRDRKKQIGGITYFSEPIKKSFPYTITRGGGKGWKVLKQEEFLKDFSKFEDAYNYCEEKND